MRPSRGVWPPSRGPRSSMRRHWRTPIRSRCVKKIKSRPTSLLVICMRSRAGRSRFCEHRPARLRADHRPARTAACRRDDPLAGSAGLEELGPACDAHQSTGRLLRASFHLERLRRSFRRDAPAQIARSATWLAVLGAGAIGLLTVFAALVARTTIYTITTKRVVIRFGIAIPMTIQVSYPMIEAAAVQTWPNGAGDVAITLIPNQRIGYLIIWPHARPWKLAKAQPTL